MSNNASSSEDSDSDSPAIFPAVSSMHGRDLTRTFVHLEKRSKSVPRGAAIQKLQDAGRMKNIGFKRKESAAEIERKLLDNFPTLAGKDMSW